MGNFSNRHIMESNARLVRQIYRDIFDGADTAWVKVYSAFCKRQAEANHDTIMQFKYKGHLYHLHEDVPIRGGVKPLHPSLEAEFKESYQMFVVETVEEKRILQNMLAHAVRIAKYAEDLIELLPEVMHESITESGFFQLDSKPPMSIDDRNKFNELYEQHFGLFDMRKTLSTIM